MSIDAVLNPAQLEPPGVIPFYRDQKYLLGEDRKKPFAEQLRKRRDTEQDSFH